MFRSSKLPKSTSGSSRATARSCVAEHLLLGPVSVADVRLRELLHERRDREVVLGLLIELLKGLAELDVFVALLHDLALLGPRSRPARGRSRARARPWRGSRWTGRCRDPRPLHALQVPIKHAHVLLRLVDGARVAEDLAVGHLVHGLLLSLHLLVRLRHVLHGAFGASLVGPHFLGAKVHLQDLELAAVLLHFVLGLLGHLVRDGDDGLVGDRHLVQDLLPELLRLLQLLHHLRDGHLLLLEVLEARLAALHQESRRSRFSLSVMTAMSASRSSILS